MTMRATFLFAGPLGESWSEQWYRAGVNHTSTLTAIQQADVGWLATRTALLHPAFRVAEVSISNVDQPRDGRVSTFGAIGRGRYATLAARPNEPQPASVGLRIRFYAGLGRAHWRTSILRGVSEDVSMDGRTIDPASTALAAIISFQSALVTQGWQLRLRARTTVSDLTNVILVDNQVRALVCGAIPGGVIRGSVVEVVGALGVSNLDGRYTVTATPFGTTLPVRKRQRKSYGELPPVGGLVYRLEDDYSSVNDNAILGMGTRKTRGPFGRQAGRRRVRRN